MPRYSAATIAARALVGINEIISEYPRLEVIQPDRPRAATQITIHLPPITTEQLIKILPLFAGLIGAWISGDCGPIKKARNVLQVRFMDIRKTDAPLVQMMLYSCFHFSGEHGKIEAQWAIAFCDANEEMADICHTYCLTKRASEAMESMSRDDMTKLLNGDY